MNHHSLSSFHGLSRTTVLALLLLSPAPSDAAPNPNTLAEGPLEITVTLWDARKKTELAFEPAELFVLTKEKAIYRLVKDGRVFIKFANQGDVFRITTGDGKTSWTNDHVLKQFSGKVLPAQAVQVKPLECTKLQEERFLFFNFEYLNLAVEAALRADDRETAKILRDRAKALAVYIEDRSLNKRLETLYKSLDDHGDNYGKAAKQVTEVRAKVFESLRRIDEETRAAQARDQFKAIMGFAQSLFAAMPQADSAYKLDSSAIEALSPTSLGDIVGGLGQTIGAGYEHQLENARIEYARVLLKNSVADDYGDSVKKLRALSRRRSDEIRMIGSAEFGLSKQSSGEELEDLTSKMSSKFDFQTLIQLQTERASFDRDSTNRDNPFRLRELCFTRANRPAPGESKAKQADQFHENARHCVAATQIIPPSRIYDVDRGEFLLQAARLANKAAELEIGNGTLKSAYNFRSLYAMRILDRVELLVPIDLNGLIREQRLYALTGCSQIKEATDLAAQMGNQRLDNLRFQFQIAKAFGADGNGKKTAEYLDRAMKAGFTNMELCRRCEDIKAIAASNAEMKALLDIKATARIRYPINRFGPNRTRAVVAEFKNTTSFPLTNVKLKLECAFNGKLIYSKDFGPFERIDGNATVTVKLDAIQVNQLQQWKLSFVATQGKKDRINVEVIAD